MSEWIDIKEFRALGYLEEVNRRFFHPIGLAMATTVHEDGSESLAGVLDWREDPEGGIMGYSSWPEPEEKRQEARDRAAFIDGEASKRWFERMSKFGWFIQPAGVDAPA